LRQNGEGNNKQKKLNDDFRAKVQPLSDMRKLIKDMSGVDEDLLNMKGGILARRLTSNAISNPQIRQILRNIDKALKGKTSVSIEGLQDFYNLLNKYYDITGKTSLQGEIGSALDKSSIKGFVTDKIRNIAGESTAVKQKVLDDIIKEVLN
jgi:hypothetical protein